MAKPRSIFQNNRLNDSGEYQKRKKRKHHRRRAAIEPIIGHLRSEHRTARNFHEGQIGDSMNFIMAAAGFNFRKLMLNSNKSKVGSLRKWS